MSEEYDVEPVVEANSVEEVATSETLEEQVSDKEFNFRTLSSERDTLKAENAAIKAQLEQQNNMKSMFGAFNNQSQSQVPENNTQLNFDEAVDGEQLSKLSGHFSTEAEKLYKQTQSQSQRLEELEIKLQDKDYNATLQKYLPQVLQEKPELVEELKRSPNALKKAYYEATHSYQYFKDKMAKEQGATADTVVKNAMKQKTLGSTGSVQPNVGGTVDVNSMSSEQFAQLCNKIRKTGSA